MFKTLSKLFGHASESDQENANQNNADAQPDSSIQQAVSTTGEGLFGKIKSMFSGRTEAQLSSEDFDDLCDLLEESLIRADAGLDTAVSICDKLRQQKSNLKTQAEVLNFLKAEFQQILAPYEAANTLAFDPNVLNVYLVVGVNGAGKTTLIGKLAHQFTQAGQTVVIGAGDTFRAAAEDQLEIWAQRAGAHFIAASAKGDSSGKAADPAAVMFDAIEKAKATDAKVLLLDTAGRLQNKFNLMEELRKVKRLIDKQLPENARLESLLVLDATTGQNGLKQAEVFREAVELTGVALTKLDGSAKGGIVLSIAKEYQLPVKLVGIGEKITDLKPFVAQEYLDGLFQGIS